MASLSVRRTLPAPPALPPRRYQAKDSQRQASCTHTHMVRIWQEWGEHYCHLCQRHQPIGFVYRCVQDHAGTLPQSDFVSSATPSPQNFEPDWEVKLSGWIVEAIDRGEYTPDQVQKIVEQKIGVKRAIFAEARPETPTSSSSSDQSSTVSGSADHSTFSSLPTTLDEELLTADQNEKSGQPLSNESGAGATSRFSVPLSTCDFHCCHACRPTYRERAWQILDRVVNEPCKLPPSWELENRPISNARLLAQIGLSKPHDTYDEFQYLFSSEVDDKLSTQIGDSESGHENALTRQRTHSFRHKFEFEEAVRGVINMGAEDSGFANQHSRPLSSSSSHGSLARASRSMLLTRDVPNPASTRASTTTDPSSSQLNLTQTVTQSGEVEVEDGIAIAEEGLNLGTAGIIIQV